MSERKYSTEAAIVFWLHQAHHAVRGEILRLFKSQGHEITAEQWSILWHLWQHDGCSQTELARASGRDKPGVTRLVDSMEDKGLVKRGTSPTDRRSYSVQLTPAGRALHDTLGATINQVVQKGLRGLAADDREAVRAGLKRIYANLRGSGIGMGEGSSARVATSVKRR